MIKGRLGFPRPLAVEKELLDVTFQGYDIKEATLSAANGVVIMDELKPYFEIDSVYSTPKYILEDDLGTSASIDSKSMIDAWDIRLWANNISNMIDSTIFPNDIEIRPSITSNRSLGVTGDVPVLVIKFTATRGTHKEFVSTVKEVVSKYNKIDLQHDEHNEGEHIYYTTSYHGVKLNHVIDMARKILGPRNKRVTDVYLSTIGVDDS